MSVFTAKVLAEFAAYADARRAAGIDERLRTCNERRRGVYSVQEAAAIRKTGSPLTYAQITPIKCITAAAFLHGLYIGKDRAWRVEPTPEPELPEQVGQKRAELLDGLATLLATEAAGMAAAGTPPTRDVLIERARMLTEIAERDLQKKAWQEAARLTKAIDDVLRQGGFYEALGECIKDFVAYPYAVLRGPVMRAMPVRVWGPDGRPTTQVQVVPTWDRVDPGYIWWTHGATSVEDAVFIEKMFYFASDLEMFIGLPKFIDKNLREVIRKYGKTGYTCHETLSPAPTETADRQKTIGQDRGSHNYIEVIAYSGRISGSALMEFTDLQWSDRPEAGMVYYINTWVVDEYVLYLDITPDTEATPIYSVAQYDHIPGSLVGRALPEMLADIQDSANTTVRALVRNIAIASGPQVVVNRDRLADNSPAAFQLNPWKVWHVVDDPIAGNIPPVTFFQPPLNAGELLQVLQQLMMLADEVSGLPRYMSGSGALGTIGRTASGISMMLGRATETMKAIAHTIDTHIVQPAVMRAFRYLQATRTDLTGDAKIVVLGATKMMEDDAKRVRLMEFAAMTANPVDLNLLGMDGRLNILRAVAEGLDMPNEMLVPSSAQVAAAQMASMVMPSTGGAGSPSAPMQENGGTAIAPIPPIPPDRGPSQ